MFGCDGISDHASWNEVFHYWDTKLSCPGQTQSPSSLGPNSLGPKVQIQTHGSPKNASWVVKFGDRPH